MKAKTKGGETIASAVRRAVTGRPAIADALKLGVVNYHALARLVSGEVGGPGTDAVVSALKRLRRELEYSRWDEGIRELVANSTVSLRPDVAVITLPAGFDWKSLQASLRAFQVVEGPNATIIVVDERVLDSSSSPLTKGFGVRRGLAAVTLKSPSEMMDTPGALCHFLFPIGLNGINIEEVMSCYTDKIIIFKLEDAQNAFTLLNDLIRKTREELKSGAGRPVKVPK
ncbi:hypothetical protein HY995_04060 [Candidatus Micrarchaeota archaeon]|nr:hypothetical protein [Candidatus Micrarchaeota archaeon]